MWFRIRVRVGSCRISSFRVRVRVGVRVRVRTGLHGEGLQRVHEGLTVDLHRPQCGLGIGSRLWRGLGLSINLALTAQRRGTVCLGVS